MNLETFYYKVVMMRRHQKKYWELKKANAAKEIIHESFKRFMAFQNQVDEMISKREQSIAEFLGR